VGVGGDSFFKGGKSLVNGIESSEELVCDLLKAILFFRWFWYRLWWDIWGIPFISFKHEIVS